VDVKQRDWLSRLIRIHKGEAGPVFKVITVSWAVGLLLLFLSGTYLGLSNPALRRPLLAAMGIGVFSFAALIAVS
ncbi:MAG: hypothetical protein Q7R45_04160, partial [Sulfuricaulis sp.]|nr:hypothetical protein [Sulfuricaulis sp.]